MVPLWEGFTTLGVVSTLGCQGTVCTPGAISIWGCQMVTSVRGSLVCVPCKREYVCGPQNLRGSACSR